MPDKLCKICGKEAARNDVRHKEALCFKCANDYKRREALNPDNKMFNAFLGVKR